jgi:DNA polymerase III subunit epsilon
MLNKTIVLDTETSGIMDYKRPADAEGQPRVAEVGLIFLDETLKVEREYQTYIQPDGWDLGPDAIAVHGLTIDFLREHGVPVQMPLAIYTQAILEGRDVIAHGAQFDCKMMRAELRRAGLDDLFEQTRSLCIMRGLMSHAKQTGRWLYKYDEKGDILLTKKGEPAGGMPKLTDACRYFNIPIVDKAHGALGDARLATLIYQAMVAEGFDREATVHYSKNHEEIRNAQ